MEMRIKKSFREKKNKQEYSISTGERVSFGLGDFALNGTFTLVSSYLLYYYTDGAKISLSTAGVILLLGRAADALTSIWAGVMVDKVQTKMGRCRPFLLAGIVPMMLLMCMLFYMPDFSETQKLIYGCISYILFSCFYAFLNVPYSTMLSVVTDKAEERISFNIYKNFGGNAGAVFVTLLTFSILGIMGTDDNSGYLKTAGFYAVFFLLSMMICIRYTKERICEISNTVNNWKDSAMAAAGNKSWLMFIGIQCLGMLYMIIHNQGTFYYTKYYLEKEYLNTILLTMTPLTCIFCAFILPAFAKKIKVRNILTAGHFIVLLSLGGTVAAGKNTAVVIVFAFFTSLGWSIATGMIFVMLSQLIDRTEKQSNKRPQGLMTSVMTFLMKMGVAMAGYAAPAVLKAGGYAADTKAEAGALLAIQSNFIYIPAAISIIVIIMSIGYSRMEKREEVYWEV
ncbi:MFS transporter [Clostridium sp. C105KSO13]|uniref:MFS transporter n=1 Tax=Clostridium sp. C105KSO13 TaxID=1776045 RepID=UPI0007405F98|nr:glycoside-pentoside-hexuronide (GPH):cation symporter [Clostridium sp. C105KSO13]CUX35348.1 putative symporter YjmB [Clostridium sp. C105KSO13]